MKMPSFARPYHSCIAIETSKQGLASAAAERGGHGALVRVASRQADAVQVGDDDRVRAPQARLGVRDVELRALRTHDDPGAGQVRPSHVGEEVMLHLVVEPAERPGRPPPGDVARRAHLLGEEVEALVGTDDRHAFVVGGEGGAHVDPEDDELNTQERHRHPEGEQPEQQAEEDDEPARDQAQLEPPTSYGSALHEVLHPLVVEVDALKREQREEQPALSECDPATQTSRLRGIFLDERDRVGRDVGILADHVRVAVVPGVLGVPPRIADPDDAGREEPGEAIVPGPTLEDRAVRGLVGQERDLGHHDAQRGGDEELPPAVAQQDEPRAGAEEGDAEAGPQQDVEPLRALQQTLLAGLLRHFEECLGKRRECGRRIRSTIGQLTSDAGNWRCDGHESPPSGAHHLVGAKAKGGCRSLLPAYAFRSREDAYSSRSARLSYGGVTFGPVAVTEVLRRLARVRTAARSSSPPSTRYGTCLLYTSDAADE